MAGNIGTRSPGMPGSVTGTPTIGSPRNGQGSAHGSAPVTPRALKSALSQHTCSHDADGSESESAEETSTPAVPEKTPVGDDVEHVYFKIMLAGEAGLGKTTLIANLFSAYTSAKKGQIVEETAPSHLGGEHTAEISERCRFTWKSKDGKKLIHYKVVDTPGFGEEAENQRSINKVTNFIKKQNQKYYWRNLELVKKGLADEAEDERIACVIYLLPATHTPQVRAIDVNFMKAIGEIAPLVPVVSKADTLTSEECSKLRTKVLKVLDDQAMPYFRASNDDSPYPWVFACVSSAQVDETKGIYHPVRSYPFGVCEVLNPEHSDTLLLSKVLFEDGFKKLQRRKEEYHAALVKRGETGLVKPLETVFTLRAAVSGCFLSVTRQGKVRGVRCEHKTVRGDAERHNFSIAAPTHVAGAPVTFGIVVGLLNKGHYLCNNKGVGFSWDRKDMKSWERLQIRDPSNLDNDVTPIHIGSRVLLQALSAPTKGFMCRDESGGDIHAPDDNVTPDKIWVVCDYAGDY